MKPTREQKPRMDFSKLEETIEALHELAGSNVEQRVSSVAEQAAIYLEWMSEWLEDRKIYHKKQNLKNKTVKELVLRMLSKDEIANLDRQVDIKLGIRQEGDE